MIPVVQQGIVDDMQQLSYVLQNMYPLHIKQHMLVLETLGFTQRCDVQGDKLKPNCLIYLLTLIFLEVTFKGVQ